MPASCITVGPKSVSAGNGQPLACAAVLQPMPISCHFRGCKSAAVQDCKWRYNKWATFTFYLLVARREYIMQTGETDGEMMSIADRYRPTLHALQCGTIYAKVTYKRDRCEISFV